MTLATRLRGVWWELVVNRVGGSDWISPRARRQLYRRMGLTLGPGVRIDGEAQWHAHGDVTIGEGTYINREAKFYGSAPISLGARCVISHGVAFETTDHVQGGPSKRAGENYYRPITVEDGCFIGARVTVLRGVTIGTGTIIAAGSLVVKDCEPNAIYAGVPARLMRRIIDSQPDAEVADSPA